VSCNNHHYETLLNGLNEEIEKLVADIETLEVENKMMRSRNERLQLELDEAHKQIDVLLTMQETKDQDRIKIIEEIWKHTRKD
jgi:peptidoglycan hydrolase CwlO-like protein